MPIELFPEPHIWFVPVTGGRGYGLMTLDPFRRVAIEPFNVQWDFGKFPVEQSDPPVEESCVQAGGITTTIMGTEGGDAYDKPSKLSQCHGSWKWRSCHDDDDPSNIIVGGQLAVGTVFSRFLPVFSNFPTDPVPPAPYTYDTVEAWVKFRISSTTALSAIYFTINDMAGNVIGLNAAPANWLASTAANTWRVAHAWKTANWEDPDWDPTNLRAMLSVQGTTTGANAGPVTVDAEWFAFRLNQVWREVP